VEAAFGVLAGVLQLAAAVPYLRDVLGGSTKPQRATWMIWTSLSVVVLASQWASGATWSLALTAGQALSCGTIFALSIRRGAGGVSALELALLGLAAVGVAGWQVAGDPTVATCSVVVADLVAVALMLPKTYRQPASETLATYALGVVSTIFALLAIGSGAAALWIYPLYILAADSGVVAVIVLRRRALATVAA
jgi:O-antigen ligase